MDKIGLNILILLLFVFLILFQYESVGLCDFSEIDSKQNQDDMGQYYYKMDESELLMFLNKLEALRKGDFVLKVKAMLGEPDSDQNVANKKYGKQTFRVLDYYIMKWKENVVNENKDRSISLFFDLNNRLVVIISNVDGFEVPKELKDIPRDGTGL